MGRDKLGLVLGVCVWVVFGAAGKVPGTQRMGVVLKGVTPLQLVGGAYKPYIHPTIFYNLEKHP